MINVTSVLPHNFPFVLVDRILETEYMKSAKGFKNITYNEPWVTGHFPNQAIYPGVLMIETMAQIGGFIFVQPNSQKISDRMVLCGVKNLKIIHPVVPGDTLVVESVLVHNIGHLFQIQCTGFVNDMKVSTGLISLARLNGEKFKDGSEEESE